jgi:hypothetical protein
MRGIEAEPQTRDSMNARAISAVLSPPTARHARATWETGVSDG